MLFRSSASHFRSPLSPRTKGRATIKRLDPPCHGAMKGQSSAAPYHIDSGQKEHRQQFLATPRATESQEIVNPSELQRCVVMAYSAILSYRFDFILSTLHLYPIRNFAHLKMMEWPLCSEPLAWCRYPEYLH